MVQILPTPTNLGTSLGQGLGSGLAQGIQQGGQVGFQRSMLQNALKGIENPSPGTTPFQLASQLMQATAGIPGAERYVGELFRLLQGQLRGQNTNYLGGAIGGQGAASPAQGPGAEFENKGGYLAPPMTQNELLQNAKQFSMGDPAQLSEGINIGNKLNEGSQQRLQYIRQRANDLKVTDDELPYFMQMAEKSSEKNPEKLLVDTKRSLDQIRSLDRALVPGLARGIAQKTPPGFLPSMLAGTESRETAVRRLKGVVDPLIKEGHEPIVRQKLAALQLSPTEVEDLIHPMSKQLESKIESFPKPSKSPEQRDRMLVDFYRKNIDSNTSLLVLRHKLWEKGYGWEDQSRAIQEAQKEGLSLNDSQRTELTEFTTRPPRDSMLDIFKDWDQLTAFLRGQK